VVVNTTGGTVSVPTNAGQDGNFKITLPEVNAIAILDQYRIPLPAGFSVNSFTYGSVDLLKNPSKWLLNDTAETRSLG
jgi:hypothetical protein